MASEYTKLGKAIQKQRKSCGLTQDELADAADVSYSTITKIERGAIASPSVFTVACIAKVLNTTVGELLGEAPISLASEPSVHIKKAKTFVFSDMNGVLVRFYQKAFTEIAHINDLPIDKVETAFWHYNDAGNRGEMTLNEFNEAMAETLSLKHFNWEEAYMRCVEPITEMHRCLEEVSKTHRVGLLTNTYAGFVGKMIKKGLIPDIEYDCIIDSSEVKSIKPEQKIYEIAEERAGVRGKDILFIDDSRTNLMAAGRLDWRGLWFDDFRPEESVQRVREALKE